MASGVYVVVMGRGAVLRSQGAGQALQGTRRPLPAGGL